MTMEKINEKIELLQELADATYTVSFDGVDYQLDSEQRMLVVTFNLEYIGAILDEIVSLVY